MLNYLKINALVREPSRTFCLILNMLKLKNEIKYF